MMNQTILESNAPSLIDINVNNEHMITNNNNNNSDVIKEFRCAFLEKYLESNRVGRKTKCSNSVNSSSSNRTRTFSNNNSLSKSLTDKKLLSTSFSPRTITNKPYFLKKSSSIDLTTNISKKSNEGNEYKKNKYKIIENESNGFINSSLIEEFLSSSPTFSSYQDTYNVNSKFFSSESIQNFFDHGSCSNDINHIYSFPQDKSSIDCDCVNNNNVLVNSNDYNSNNNNLMIPNKVDELLKTFEDDIKIFSFELESIILN